MRQMFKAKFAGSLLIGLICCTSPPMGRPLYAQAAAQPSGTPEPPLRPIFLPPDHEDAGGQVEGERLFELLQSKIAFNEYSEAVQPAEQLLELATLEFGPGAAELAEPMVNLGQAQELAGQATQARATYLSCLELISAQFGSLDRRLIRPQAGLARLAEARGDHKAAVKHFSEARYLLRRSKGLYSMEQIPLLEAAARSLVVLGEPQAANLDQRIVYDLYRRELGDDSPELVQPLIRLGNWNGLMYLSLSPRSQASMACMIDRRALPDYTAPNQCLLPGQRDLYRMAIEIIETHYGKDDPRLIEPLRALANSYYLMSVRWVRRQDFQVNPFAADTSTTYYEAVGQEGDARRALDRALAIIRQEPEHDPKDEAQLLVDLGDWHIAFRRDISEGLNNYRQAWELFASGDGGAAGANLVFKDPVQLEARTSTYPNLASYGMEYHRPEPKSLGHATLQFDITGDGRVVNASIVKSDLDESRGLARRALRVLSHASFRPRIVDGTAVYTTGVIMDRNFTTGD